MSTGISPAVALSEGKFFTTFFTVSSETNWKENFLFTLSFLLYFKYNWVFGQFSYNLLNFIVTINRFTNPIKKIQWICDSKWVLKAILLFSETILSFSINLIFKAPCECLFEKYASLPKWFVCCFNV